MANKNYGKKNISTILLTLFVFLIMSTSSLAATYYASASGSGDGKSQNNPFKIDDFWDIASPGDTLYLLNGTYTDRNSMINPPSSVDGTSNKPITIKSLNDGEALINGANTGKPVHLNGNNYFILEGFNACNAGSANQGRVVRLDNSDNTIVRRVVGWDGDPNENSKIFMTSGSNNVLFEDCAGWGSARKIFSAYKSSNVTFRRCFLRWTEQHTAGGPYSKGMTICYLDSNILIENCIGTWDETGMNSSNNLIRSNIIGTDSSGSGTHRIYGTIVYALNSQSGPNESPNGAIQFVDGGNEIIGKDLLVYVEKDYMATFTNNNAAAKYENNTFIGGGYDPYQSSTVYLDDLADDMKYSIVQNSARHGVNNCNAIDYVNFYNNAKGNCQSGAPNHSSTSNPKLIDKCGNILQYGLSETERPKVDGVSVGAKIQNRYVDGILTDKPLWPWPMNERIKEAMIVSGYDKKGGLDGDGGINLTKTIFELGGGRVPSQFISEDSLPTPQNVDATLTSY